MIPRPRRKNLIERAYRIAEILGLAVWCEDEAGPYQTIPYPGYHWCLSGQPQRQPHEYFREGTAKMLTLFHPATRQVRMKGVTHSPNVILHTWLKTELTAILASLPAPVPQSAEQTRYLWQSWGRELDLAMRRGTILLCVCCG